MKTKMLAVLAASLMATSINAAELTLELSGLKAGEGNIRIALFDQAEQFFDGEYRIGEIVEAPSSGDSKTVSIGSIPAGEYAISVYQDLNESQSLDTNLFGIPKEPYGFSGDWKRGAASYEEAKILIDDSGKAISIRLR
ncbi:DUF2141 domain-containing protein [Paraferrimonas sedimenticola]|uniref:DUF2141 domain-containing protein n=1 Tax=Paraferrimonas sedimenticola TaxID=375674 RepID=A0AA37W1E8_9GAMM|nr:DUF2141 domain-containing protein [Paraferrimonas sedimenticola]GLP96177.1 hypothetical protein GCM10007895_14830 [Paraferrimonas sedimenticola]